MDADLGLCATASTLVACRICHDEDDESNMDSPCACRGSLKYAHSKCIQLWCHYKGDVVCEICLQPFKRGYHCRLAFDLEAMSLHTRRHGELPWTNFGDPSVPMMAAGSSFMEPVLIEYPSPSSRTILYCRIITALQFLMLLILRHALPFIITADGEQSVTLCTVLLLGVLLSILAMVGTCSAIQRWRLHEELDLGIYLPTSSEENELRHQQARFHMIRIQ